MIAKIQKSARYLWLFSSLAQCGTIFTHQSCYSANQLFYLEERVMSERLPKYAYFRGGIVPIDEAKVSVMTHALNYGTAVFGGLRGYWNDEEEELFVMRPLDHFKRVLNSAGLLRMELGKTPAELADILRELLRAEGYRENTYIRPLAYKAGGMISVKLQDIPHEFTIFALPFGRYAEQEEGLHACFSSWQRISDNMMPARGKVAGAYVNSSLIKSDALLAGYDEALVLTTDGHVSEASAANVMMVRDGKLITSPITDDILEGITRRSILELAQKELGLEVVERKIDRTEVYICDELFMCGTGMQVAAVTRVEHRPIGNGKMGEITRKIRDLYFDIVFGRVPKYRHWLMPVYADEKIEV
jgi:branched-chain amino acid aminotransferase